MLLHLDLLSVTNDVTSQHLNRTKGSKNQRHTALNQTKDGTHIKQFYWIITCNHDPSSYNEYEMPGPETSSDVILKDSVSVGQHVVVHIHLVQRVVRQLLDIELK